MSEKEIRNSYDRDTVFSEKVLKKLYGRSVKGSSPTGACAGAVKGIQNKEESLPGTCDKPANVSVDTAISGVSAETLPEQNYEQNTQLTGRKIYGVSLPPDALSLPLVQEGSLPEEDDGDSCASCKKVRLEAGDCCTESPAKQTLNKNQKRKLKKKRRKERLKVQQGQEFVYEENISSPTDDADGDGVQPTDAEVTSLKEFFKGIWDIYCREDTRTDYPEQQGEIFLSLLQNIHHWSSDVIHLMQSIKSLLVHKLPQALNDKFESLEQFDCILPEELDLVQALSSYWTKNIINCSLGSNELTTKNK